MNSELKIVKTGNLFQVIKKGIGTVYQAHSREDARSWVECHRGRFCTYGVEYKNVGDSQKVYGVGNVTRVRVSAI